MKVQAKRTFATAGIGRVRRGDVVDVPALTARQLVDRGTVTPYEGPQETKPAGPTEFKPIGATETIVYRCKVCDRDFNSSRGLAMHARVHAEPEEGLAD